MIDVSEFDMIEQIFKELGFTNNEVKLYLLLAESGKATAQLLAKRSRIARTTTYSVLESLMTKGLVAEEKKQGTTFFVVNKPNSILRTIQREHEQVKRREGLAKDLIEMITPYFKSKFFSIPKMQFFEGKNSVENMLYQHLEDWRGAIAQTDYTWWGYQDHTFVEYYLPWLESYWKIKTEREKIKLLSNQASVEDDLKDKVPGRVIKPISPNFDFSSSVWVCGDYIILVMTRQEPHYAFQIRDAVFGENLRLVFKLLWERI